MESLSNRYENWSNEKLWNAIFQNTLVEGAVLRIETEEETFQSLPFSRDTVEKTELYANGRLVLCYRKPPEGEIGVLPLHSGIRPVVNDDFTIVSFRDTRVKDPSVEPEAVELVEQFITIEKAPAFERPKKIYHGSVDADIAEFIPRTTQERHDEGPRVYASPNIRIAKQSMANKFVTNGGVVNARHFVCIPMSESEFRSADRGGYIYELPSDSFTVNGGLGYGETEWVSKQPVKPSGKTFYVSIFAELKKIGVEIFFIKPEQVAAITTIQKDSSPEALEVYLNGLKK